jgi:hypothetical protein
MIRNDAFLRAREILFLSSVLLAPPCGSLALGCSRPSAAPPSPPSLVAASPCTPTATDASLEAATSGGFGAPLETLFLDGTRATLVVHETDDVGLAVGAFGACVTRDSARAFEDLVTRAAEAHEPRTLDGATVNVTWRSGARALTASTNVPPSSPAGRALVAQMNAVAGAARATPLAAVRLELGPPQATEAGARYPVRLVNVGTASLTVALPDGGPWLEASDLPLESAMWSPFGAKGAALSPTVLAPSAGVDLPIPIAGPSRGSKPFALLARYNGKIDLAGAPHLDGIFFTRLASNLVEVGSPAR